MRYSVLLLNQNSTLFKNYLVLLFKKTTLMMSRYQTIVINLIILIIKREKSWANDGDFQNGLI